MEWLTEGSSAPARKEQVALSTNAAFDGNDQASVSEPRQQEGGPYAVKGAAHAHDRIEERTPFARDNVRPLQQVVDSLGLEGGVWHLPLRGRDGQVLGYAQFKTVPNRKGPVLATILGPTMRPGGQSLEQYTKRAAYSEVIPPERHQLLTHGNEQPADYAIRHGFDRATTPTSGETYE
jgi:hypothetical protein